MEPGVSLQQHVFRELGQHTYRDINEFNPLKIDHPLNQSYLSEEERSPIGDGDPNSINILIPQDCGGFNLGSFMIRRSDWTDRLLDVWWDPVHYEQKHMEWEHKEQDALEYMYREQPWIRPHVGFVSQRLINSFPPGACGDPTDGDPYHYSEKDRDFLVNMAGCNWGRDCWAELRQYDKLSNRLNRGYVGRWKDWIRSSLKF